MAESFCYFCQTWAVPKWHRHKQAGQTRDLNSLSWTVSLKLNDIQRALHPIYFCNEAITFSNIYQIYPAVESRSNFQYWHTQRKPKSKKTCLFSSLISFLGNIQWPKLGCGSWPKNLEVGFWLPLPLASLQAVVAGTLGDGAITWFAVPIMHSPLDYWWPDRKEATDKPKQS